MTRTLRRPHLPVFLAAVLASLLICASAAAATAKPILYSPSETSDSSSPLVVRFELPEAASVGTAVLVFKKGETLVTTVTLGKQEDSAGEHTVSLKTGDLTANEHEVASAAPTATLLDGTYEVTLGYRNVALEPLATVSAAGVTIDTVTLAPTVTAPTSEAELEGSFAVGYELPEAALPDSVELLFEGEETGVSTILLTSGEAGKHTVTVNPADPAGEAGIASAPAKLGPGSYKFHLAYRDVLDNPTAATAPIKLTLLAAKCLAGSYSDSGRAPCAKAVPGHYVEKAGATTETPCPPGTYDPSVGSVLASACLEASPGHYVGSIGSALQTECEAGSYTTLPGQSVCQPADFGHYVPTSGATGETECPAGTYNDLTGRSSCEIVPAGHYAPAGSTLAIPCLPGTFNPEPGGGSTAACLIDQPGYFSGQGASAATRCFAGTYTAMPETFECAVAEPGFYVEDEGAVSEAPCPAGTFSPFYGAVECAAAPAGTYAPEGATLPIACPSGTEAPAPGSASCTAVAKLPSTIVTPSTPVVTPSTPAAQPALKCTVSAAGKQVSLHQTGMQAFQLSCNLAATLSVRVSVTITSGHRHTKLTSAAAKVSTLAGASARELLAVKLTKTARSLLKSSRARVKLAIGLYESSAATATPISTVTLTGRG